MVLQVRCLLSAAPFTVYGAVVDGMHSTARKSGKNNTFAWRFSAQDLGRPMASEIRGRPARPMKVKFHLLYSFYAL